MTDSSNFGPPSNVIAVFDEADLNPSGGEIALVAFTCYDLHDVLNLTNEMVLPPDGTVEFRSRNFIANSINVAIGAGKFVFKRPVTGDNIGLKMRGIDFNGDGLTNVFDVVSTRTASERSFALLDDLAFEGFAGLGEISGHNQIRLTSIGWRNYTSGLRLDGNGRTFINLMSMDKRNDLAVTELSFGSTLGSVSSVEASGVAFSDQANTTAVRIDPSKDGSWQGVTWSPALEIFVAVAGVGTRVMTSPNGVNWTARTSATDHGWQDIAWSPTLGLFAAVGSAGAGDRVMTSPDSIAWTSRTSAADNGWRSVAWAPALGLFAAVANSGAGNRVMTSPDGVNWTSRTSAADNGWQYVTWSPELTLFVAVASSGAGNRVMTSPDGVNWTSRTSAADNDWRGVAWSPELTLFVAVAQSGAGNRVMTSPDGVAWTARTTPADNSWRGVTWSPELTLFVVVARTGAGDRVMTSPDGIAWTSRTSATDNEWLDVTWSPELTLLVAVDLTGEGDQVMTSPDGIAWTSRSTAGIRDGRITESPFLLNSGSRFADPAGLDQTDRNWFMQGNADGNDSEYIGSMGFSGNSTDTVIANQGVDGVITAIADAGGGDIRVESAGHGRSVSDEVVLGNKTGYDGTYAVTNIFDANNFDVTATFDPEASGTGEWEFGWADILGAAALGDQTERYTVMNSPNRLLSGIKNTKKGVAHYELFPTKSGGAQNYEFRLFKNGVAVSLGKADSEITNVVGAISKTATVSSNSSDEFKVMARNMSGTTDFLSVGLSLNIK